MQKIVINDCYGGFGLSRKAIDRLQELGHEIGRIAEQSNFVPHKIQRDDPLLVQVVEELGEKANGRFAELKVVEVPNRVKWQIEQYDGREWVAEKHRTWE